jgi:hypothetical protein
MGQIDPIAVIRRHHADGRLRARSGNSVRRHRRAFRPEHARVRVETTPISRPFPAMCDDSFAER